MAKDIMLDVNGDLEIENGDWKVGDSLDQETAIIMNLNAGELKKHPLLGPALVRMMNSNTTQSEMRQRIKLHLRMDGKEARNLTITEGETRNINLDVEQL